MTSEVYLYDAGEENRNVARMAGLLAQRWGVAAICIGVGQGLAVVLENVSA